MRDEIRKNLRRKRTSRALIGPYENLGIDDVVHDGTGSGFAACSTPTSPTTGTTVRARSRTCSGNCWNRRRKSARLARRPAGER